MEEQIKQGHPVLHKYLFTVTTFSKVLAMILFIFLPFVGFYLGMQYQKAISPQNSNTSVQEIQIIPKPSPTPNISGCNNDSDCQNGAKCMAVGPLVANQPVHKICVRQGQAIPQ